MSVLVAAEYRLLHTGADYLCRPITTRECDEGMYGHVLVPNTFFFVI